ncbi:hypothetical protein [Amycolatopsis decaplanina]|uniref:Uncharacterized protein n=1 Tax=Amycolatopsis decaplanina DSM 44594 TaxID=1284240 RepID=M2ZPJ3_9PSEU|nr:hypothetical protein [Amycolatopsis decaplanina]EME62738.1 hypothetical protein H074_07501 [Amycolatopsis decaplanina DSM 44594]
MTTTREFTLARVFDFVDPETGPGFAPGRPRIEDPEELRALVAYLAGGTPVLVTPSLLDDVVDPDRTAVVPTNFLTDGTWIWTDTVTYYLEHHGMAPEPDLLGHIRARGASAEPVPPDVVRRAAGFVLAPPGAERTPVWSAG